jgi:hypothetical protein
MCECSGSIRWWWWWWWWWLVVVVVVVVVGGWWWRSVGDGKRGSRVATFLARYGMGLHNLSGYVLKMELVATCKLIECIAQQ